MPPISVKCSSAGKSRTRPLKENPKEAFEATDRYSRSGNPLDLFQGPNSDPRSPMVEHISQAEFADRYERECSSLSKNEPGEEEFKALSADLSALLEKYGEEQWDYFLEFDTPSTCVTYMVINNKSFLGPALQAGLNAVLDNRPAWALKVEFYDNIKKDTMVAGDCLGEIFLNKQGGFGWGKAVTSFGKGK